MLRDEIIDGNGCVILKGNKEEIGKFLKQILLPWDSLQIRVGETMETLPVWSYLGTE